MKATFSANLKNNFPKSPRIETDKLSPGKVWTSKIKPAARQTMISYVSKPIDEKDRDIGPGYYDSKRADSIIKHRVPNVNLDHSLKKDEPLETKLYDKKWRQ